MESAGQTQGVPLRASVQTFSVDRSLSLCVSLSLFSQKQLSPVLFVQMCKLVDVLARRLKLQLSFLTVCCAHEALRTLHLSRDEGQARRRRLGVGKSSVRAELGQLFGAGLDPANEQFWQRALHALGHDSAWSSGVSRGFRSACVNFGWVF